MTPALAPDLTRAVLAHLQVAPAAPDLVLLDTVIQAYGRTVPWESASRMVKRSRTTTTAACPRWSAEFWHDALRYGTGGTCFESNRAFLALLHSLGYDGYLTINNMQETIGCHTAIILNIHDERWLVDAGYPLYAAIPLHPERQTQRASPFFTYTVQPLGAQRYMVENIPHPKPYLFDLIDVPIEDAAYCHAMTNDYGAHGLFLQRLIIRKVVHGRLWRFDSDEQPYHLQEFHDGVRSDHPIQGRLAAHLSRHFGIAEPIIAEALSLLA